MARIEVLLSDEVDKLLRKRADSEQSTVSDCVRSLIEQVLTRLDVDADGEDDEDVREGFAEFAREYPSIRRELFDDDPDLSLDAPFEPDVDHDSLTASSMSKRAFTGHLTDRHVYAMAVRIPRDAKLDSDPATMARDLEPPDWSPAAREALSKFIVHMFLAGDEPLDGPVIVYPRPEPVPHPPSTKA